MAWIQFEGLGEVSQAGAGSAQTRKQEPGLCIEGVRGQRRLQVTASLPPLTGAQCLLPMSQVLS
jgi:hypothetical protein